MQDLIKDYEDHGYELVDQGLGTITFSTTKDRYFKKMDKKIHKNHPIWFDDDSKNFQGTGSRSIIKSMCATCNQPIVDGKCISCGKEFGSPTAKAHIPWKHELSDIIDK